MHVPTAFRTVLVCLLFVLLATGCGDTSAQGQGRGGGRGSGMGGGKGRPATRDAIAVEAVVVRQQPLSSIYSSTATLRPRRQATVTARTKGVVERLLVEAGDEVREGALLARLEDADQRIAAKRARLMRDTKREEHARSEELSSQGLIAVEVHATKRRERDESEVDHERAQLDLARTRVKAPFAGRILERQVDTGATVSDGTALFILADLTPMEADVDVSERQVSQLQVGQPVRVRPDAGGDAVAARISRIAPAVRAETGTVKVTIEVDEAEGLRPGSFLRVEVVTETHEDALVVPRNALVAEGRRWHVFELSEDRQSVRQVDVQPGFEEGELVELRAPDGGPSPVTEGALVISLGAPALSDGAPVKVFGEHALPEAETADETETTSDRRGRKGERS
ncbi:MAG: efflux RND transporter periplasmic adaptor subunit [Acidobacteriota bacterium]